jgi:hypothetical protein
MKVAEGMCFEKVGTNPAGRHQIFECRSASLRDVPSEEVRRSKFKRA